MVANAVSTSSAALMAFRDPASPNLMSTGGRSLGLARRYKVQLFFSCLIVRSDRVRADSLVWRGSATTAPRVRGVPDGADRVPILRWSSPCRPIPGACPSSQPERHRAPREAAAPRARVPAVTGLDRPRRCNVVRRRPVARVPRGWQTCERSIAIVGAMPSLGVIGHGRAHRGST